MAMLRLAFPGAALTALSCRLLGTVAAGDRVVAGGTVAAVDGDDVTCDVWLDVDGDVDGSPARRAVAGRATLRRRG